MIGTRVATAFALLLGVAATAVAFTALMYALRDDGDAPGRLVETRLDASHEGFPVQFPLDDFFLSLDDDGRIHALYVYPPGHFGHMRGCRVIWDGGVSHEKEDGEITRGLFVEPCGGSRFMRDGALISGPAERGLDHFGLTPTPRGFVVDTNVLYCGPRPLADPTPGATPTPIPEREECERVYER